MTFEFGLFHQSFRMVEDNLFEEKLLPDGSTKLIHHLRGGDGTGGSISIWIKLGSKQMTDVKKLVEQKHHNRFFYYDLFYFALGLTDPLSKFMALYSILLTLCSDRQEKVDKFVISVEPSVATNPPYRKRKSGVLETIYTRLRNQVGHVRPGTTIEVTRNEMETNLSGLVAITQELIRLQP